MDKIDKSNGASAVFSSKALSLASAKRAVHRPQEERAGLGVGQRAAKGAVELAGGHASSMGTKKAMDPTRVASVGPLLDAFAVESAQRAQAMAGGPSAGLELSAESRALSGLAGQAARTVDAGAPAGSGKRLKAYGQAQQALAPKGEGFDGSA